MGKLRYVLGVLLPLTGLGCAASSAAAVDSSPSDVVASTDGAEVKVLIEEQGFDPGAFDAKREDREIRFYDTPSLDLWKNKGALLRSRRTDGPDDDVTVKFRPMQPSQLGKEWRHDADVKCELDVNVGGSQMPSCSWTGDADGSKIASGETSDLFSKDAMRFADAQLSKSDFDGLQIYGPIASTVWTIEAPELDTKLSFERWIVPGGDRTVEASIKVKAIDVDRASRDLTDWLTRHGLKATPAQKTKTAAALEALSRRP